MKTVLCFGDSNTFGYIPGSGGLQYSADVRYPGILQSSLGDDFIVVEDGLSGRTTVFDKDDLPGRKGIDYIVSSVRNSHADILLILLGTNDCKAQFDANAKTIADGMEFLADAAKSVNPDIKIIFAAPFPIGREALVLADYYNEFSITTSLRLASEYEARAKVNGYGFADTSKVVTADPLDGEHTTPEGHRAIAELFAEKIRDAAK